MAVERTARVAKLIDHAPDTRSLVLALGRDHGFSFRPGQFLSCLLPVGGERIIRPYSIASDAARPDELEILFNLVPDGPGSRHLFGLRAGDPVDFTGPWGTFTLDEPPDTPLVFIAQNTGIAPIRSMLLHAAGRTRRPLRLVYGTHLRVYHEELARLPGVTVEVVDPDRLVEETQRRFVDADADRSRHFWVCGVGPIVYTLRDRLRGAGYARRTVQYEKW
ncbi:MAG TPA: FAD-binding oxidoreductase [Candidatus Eisenbacteria bacterium]|nr:FAD-binding oxidoreductase [Candidatus Eisenbacteria bacterium]